MSRLTFGLISGVYYVGMESMKPEKQQAVQGDLFEQPVGDTPQDAEKQVSEPTKEEIDELYTNQKGDRDYWNR